MLKLYDTSFFFKVKVTLFSLIVLTSFANGVLSWIAEQHILLLSQCMMDMYFSKVKFSSVIAQQCPSQVGLLSVSLV